MKIFLSYRRNDSGRDIGRIRDRLKKEFGEQSVFRDLVDIPAGLDFRTVVDRETKGCDVMLVLIGPLWASITDANGNKRLFDPADLTRIEVETGLRRLQEKNIMVIPVLVMNARMPSRTDLPESLSELCVQNAIDIHDDPYFEFDMGRLIRDIKAAKQSPLGKIIELEPTTIYIPEGPFLMGSQPGPGISEYETPQHEVNLPAYYIGESPVKNSEYEEFVRQKGKLVPPIMGWDGQSVPEGEEDFPVLGITWDEAIRYCEWLSQLTGRKYSLPNEAQWEKACRGSYGCEEAMGQVLEWTCSLWGEKRIAPDTKYRYPWKNDFRNDLKANIQIRRVVRGYTETDETGMRRFSARSGRSIEDTGERNRRHSFRVILIA